MQSYSPHRNRPTTVSLGPQGWQGCRPGTQDLPSPQPHPGPTASPRSGGLRAPSRPAPPEEQPPSPAGGAATAGPAQSDVTGSGGVSAGAPASCAAAGAADAARVRARASKHPYVRNTKLAGTLPLLLPAAGEARRWRG